MALVVDDKGKVTASPVTGKINRLKAPQPTASETPSLSGDINVLPTTRADNRFDAAKPIQDVLRQRANRMQQNAVTNDNPHPTTTGSSAFDEFRSERSGYQPPTTNMWGEEFDQDDDGSHWFDDQVSLIGNTRTNDAYIRDAMEHGLSEEDAYDMMHLDRPWWETFVGGDRQYAGDVTAMDDGSSYDYNHMTSDTMTGTQYLRYAEMGMGGRPVEEIDPTRTYSKRREATNYGFTPFTPDSRSFMNMVVDNAMDTPSRLGQTLGGLRDTWWGDYTIRYGDGNEISGRDFDRLAAPYLHQLMYYSQFDPERVVEYVVPDINGNSTIHHGTLSAMWDNKDGTYTAEFSDGTSVDVTQDYVESIMNDDGTVTMEPSFPDLVMPDGTHMSVDDVQRIYRDLTPDDDEGDQDDDITYDFSSGPLGLDNRPRRLNQQQMFMPEGGGLWDPSTISNNAVDWTLGSLPISIGKISPWVYSMSGATSSLSGSNPASYDPVSDSYGLSAGDYDEQGNLRYGVFDVDGNRDDARSDSLRFWNTLGNAAVPLTEWMVGPVGEELVPIGKVFGKMPAYPTLAQLAKYGLIGAAEEGIEEIFGNPFEEITNYGLEGMYTDQLRNENDEPIYDVSGHELRDYDTGAIRRLINAADLADIGNAFAGGVAVDLLMQALPGGQLYKAPGAIARDVARMQTGVRPYVETEAELKAREAREKGKEYDPSAEFRHLSEPDVDDPYNTISYEER